MFEIVVLNRRQPVAAFRLERRERRGQRIVTGHFVEDVVPKQRAQLSGPEHRRGVEISPRAVERDVLEEPAAAHSIGHRIAGRAGQPSNAGGHAVESALVLLDHVLVVTAEQLVAAVA